MKLSTIWTIRSMSVPERLRRTIDTLACSLAYHLPKRVKYWAYIHVGTQAMKGRVVPEATFMELLQDADR